MHVVTRPIPPIHAMGGALAIHGVAVGEDNLSWILQCTETGTAAVVDGLHAEPVLAYAQALGLRLEAVFNTHTHGDHIGINRDLAKLGQLSRFRVVGPEARRDEIPGLCEAVREGSEVGLGRVFGHVLETPGHLDGHVSFVFGDALLCGDTLFTGGCGRLFDGPPEAMFRSLRRLSALPHDPLVLCAHEYTQDNLRFAHSVEPGNAALARRIASVWARRAEGHCTVPSRLSEELATNPFLRSDAPELVRNVARAFPGASLDSPLSVFTATRALKDRGDYRSLPEPTLAG